MADPQMTFGQYLRALAEVFGNTGSAPQPSYAAPMDTSGPYQSFDYNQTATEPSQPLPPLGPAVMNALSMPQQQQVMESAVQLGAGMAAPYALALPRAAIAAGALGYGMTTASKPVNTSPSDTADLNEVIRSLEAQGSPELTSRKGALDRANQARVDAERALTAMQQRQSGKLADGEKRPSQQSLDAARAAATKARTDFDAAQAAHDAELQRVRDTSKERAGSVMTARASAAIERDRIRKDAPQTFAKRYEDARREFPILPDAAMLPFAAGAGAVAAKQALPVASSWMNRSLAGSIASKLPVTPEAAARVTDIAAKNAANPSLVKLGDAATGAIAGGTFGLLPTTYNGLTQTPQNPDRVAADAYSATLLDIDPRKPRAEQLAKAYPERNPNYTPLEPTMDSVFNYGSKAVMGLLEGAAGGKTAGILTEALKPTFKGPLAKVNEFSDDVVAQIIRARQAKAYGEQDVTGTVPRPPQYQANPTKAHNGRSASGEQAQQQHTGGESGSQGAQGANGSQKSGSEPGAADRPSDYAQRFRSNEPWFHNHPLPDIPPRNYFDDPQVFPPYNFPQNPNALIGNEAKVTTDYVRRAIQDLASRGPKAKWAGLEPILTSQKRQEEVAAEINRNLAAAGLKQLPLQELVWRIRGTAKEFAKLSGQRDGRYSDIDRTMASVTGKRNTLAVPLAVGASAAAASDPYLMGFDEQAPTRPNALSY